MNRNRDMNTKRQSIIRYVLSLLCLCVTMMARAFEPFRFAVVTDVHINVKSKNPSEDLRQTVSAINNDDSIDFVLVTGDIADAGDGASLCLAHKLLSALHKPWYIIEGNHDQNWSESGCMDFIKISAYLPVQ